MAKVRNNIIMQGLRALLGNLLRQDKTRRTIIRAQPQCKPNCIFRETQPEQQHDFREADAYAKSACGAQIYINKAAGTSTNPYNVALADWFHAPKILEIDLGDWTGQPEKVLRIKALDDVQVKQVNIRIRNTGGAALEQGPATQVDDVWWEYTTTSTASGSLTVLVAAQDLPGNLTEVSKNSG